MSEKSEDKNNSSSGSGNKYNNNKGKGLNFGWSWGVIGIVAFSFYFFADGAKWETIETLLGFGLLAFLFFCWISPYASAGASF